MSKLKALIKRLILIPIATRVRSLIFSPDLGLTVNDELLRLLEHLVVEQNRLETTLIERVKRLEEKVDSLGEK